jgi:hypothetical protein
VLGVAVSEATPDPFSAADPTVAPPTENETVPVGTTPACVPTDTVIVVDCPSAIALDERPRVVTGTILVPWLTVSEDALDVAALKFESPE